MTEADRSWRALFGLALAAFAFFLLVGSRERPWGDATPMYEVADSLVHRGEVNISTRWPSSLETGRRGKIYALAPLVQSLVHVPGAALRRGLLRIFPGAYEPSYAFAAHIGPAALSALCLVLFLRLARRTGASLRASLLGTAALGTATMFLIYARSPYAEALQTLAFTWLFLEVLRARDNPDRRAAARVGLAAGLLLSSKGVYLLALPGAALWLYLTSAHTVRARLWRLLPWSALAALPFVGVQLFYNWVRWGHPLHSGYNFQIPVFEERLIWGLWGLFLSPGKSLFLYAPPLLLSLVAVLRWRRLPEGARAAALLLVAMATPVVLLYGKMLYWSGDYAWGPRYLAFLVPVALLPAVHLLDRWLTKAPDARASHARKLKLLAASSICAVGLWVQFLGVSLFWDHYIRIAQEAGEAWLGLPDKMGAPTKPENNICGACFEDMHGANWLPVFQPIEGHAWLFRHVRQGHDWKTAEADAPWHRHTTLPLDIEGVYARARLDYWWLELRDRGKMGLAVTLALWGLLFGGLGAYMFARSLRAGV